MRFDFGRRHVVSLLVAIGLVVFGAASASAGKPAAAPASASFGDGIEAALPANARVPSDASIDSVSCPSAGNCTAVGWYYDSEANMEGLLLTETDGTWGAGVEAALPANASPSGAVPGAFVGSVSCASAGNCTAVGTYASQVNGTPTKEGLLLTETAGTWSTGVEAATPANASPTGWVELPSVSCGSVGNCTAVGTYSGGGLMLTETAGSWATGVAASLPADAFSQQQSSLQSVSCASAGNCSAVGYYTGSNEFLSEGLLLTETAGSWAPGVKASLPQGATQDGGTVLDSVSCASPGNCSAVGVSDIGIVYLDEKGFDQELRGNGLLLTETDGTWGAGVEASLPANADGPDAVYGLNSVSCPAAGNCSAVGVYYDSSGMQLLLLDETAGSWAIGIEALPANAPTTNPSSGVGINSVSCSSAGNCSAVGTSYESGRAAGLLLTETAGTWGSVVDASLPANARTPDAFSPLYSVSCPAAGACGAGGFYSDSSDNDGALLIGGSPASVALNISTTGTGSGTVVSSGASGIDCGPTCSASFDAGTALTVVATPSPGSRFSGWSGGGCSDTPICKLDTGISEQTVTAGFTLLPKCVVPKLKGKTLHAAAEAIRAHNCRVGKIAHATSRTIRKSRVISQKPGAGRQLNHGAKVNLVVSKGRPRLG